MMNTQVDDALKAVETLQEALSSVRKAHVEMNTKCQKLHLGLKKV